jgi:hypothetical protein
LTDAEHVAQLRGRLMRMIAIDAVCVLVAIVAVVGYLSFHIAWMGAVFAGAMLAGFAAQIWLVIDFARTRPRR